MRNSIRLRDYENQSVQGCDCWPGSKSKNTNLICMRTIDWNVPLINSEQMYQALRRLGIDTMLIIYPVQSHSITTPSYKKDRYERYLLWYGHYLQGKPDKVPPKPKKEETKVAK